MPFPSFQRPAPRTALAAVTALALAGCASIRLADERDAYLRRELGAFRYEKACLDVWPAVLELLGSKGYPLQGRDRPYAGQASQGALGSFLDEGFETRQVEGGGLLVKTGWQPASESASRYLVSGNPARPTGCVISFTRIWHGTFDPANDQQEIDAGMQLELLKQLEPAAAARVEAGAPKG
jgi:hypothetical protein